MRKAAQYIASVQLEDGSWYGSWGVCFTYATWFGVGGLVAAGQSYATSAPLRAACSFLLTNQLPGGGWGESYLSCQNKVTVTRSSLSCLVPLVFVQHLGTPLVML